MGNCKDCKKYDKRGQFCNAAYWVEPREKLATDALAFYANAHDDSGLEAGVKTGPMFGCIKFQPKK